MNWIKQLFCRHYKVTFVRNIHGDEIILWNWKRSLWKCEKCGAIVTGNYPHITGEQT